MVTTNSSRRASPFAVCLALGLVSLFACGDDDSPEDDVGADAGTDTAADVSDDAAEDAGEDSGGEDTDVSDASSDATPDAPDAGDVVLARNVLLIIADDLGVDSVSSYEDPEVPRTYASTPNVAAICSDGVLFERAWSAPTCTPTRGTMFTGRYGFRTGLLAQDRASVIDLAEVTLPKVLTEQLPSMVHADIGKWHLGNTPALGGLSAPNTMGWSHYAGNIARALPAYDDWTKVVDGVEMPTSNYAMTEHTDDALAVIEDAGDDPWFVWFATNAPHSPFHLPPADLHSRDDLSGTAGDIMAQPAEYYSAMVEAFDSEVGRLLEAVDLETTLVIFVGDNGTPAQVVQPPLTRRRAKDTLYQGGLHVPLCAVGAGVINPGRSHSALVHTVDLFATILESVGAEPPASDSVSMMPYLRDERDDSAREWVFSELSDPDGAAIRGERYKLIQYDGAPNELYDLVEDPFERDNLMPMVAGDADLRARLMELQSSLDELTE